MALPHDNFLRMMAHLEMRAREDAAWFRRRAALVALLGTGYLGGMLLGLLALAAACVVPLFLHRSGALLLAIPPLLLCAVIIRALRFTPTPVQGVLLRREEAPTLFTLIDALRSMASHARVDAVLLTGDLFSEGMQRTDPDRPWRTQNILLIGLPEMLAESPEHFRAGLLHALAHLAGNHGRFDTWYARLSQTWSQLIERLEERKHWSLWLFRPFMRWYAPYFMAHAYVLSRLVEYEADGAAAALLGPRTTAERLLLLTVKDRYLDEAFWPGLSARVAEEAEPPAGIYGAMRMLLRTAMPAVETQAHLEAALAVQIQYDDVNPPLELRLEALEFVPAREGGTAGVAATLAAPLEITAAEFYLQEALPRLCERLDEAWRARMLPEWEERHTRMQEARARAAVLTAQAAATPLDEEAAWEQVELLMRLEGEEAMLAAIYPLLETYPDHTAANYLLGQHLLEQGDAEGIRYLERAMERDPWAVPEACALIHHFLTEKDHTIEAQFYQQRAEAQTVVLEAAEQERQTATDRDGYLPHALPAHEIAQIVTILGDCAEVRTAYLARKVVHHLPEHPFYVLAIVPKPCKLFQPDPTTQLLQQLASAITLPDRGTVILLTGQHHRLQRMLRKVEGAEIFQRPR